MLVLQERREVLIASAVKSGTDVTAEMQKLDKEEAVLQKQITDLDKATKHSTGQAFVTFESEKHNRKCVQVKRGETLW